MMRVSDHLPEKPEEAMRMNLKHKIAAIGALLMACMPHMVTAAAVTVPVVAAVQVVDANTQSAEAVDWNRPSRMYRNDGGWMPVWGVPRGNANAIGWVKSGTAFYMHCYTDNIWYNGNYGSGRYFYGYNGYWGYVHSSYVYNQIAVPRC